MNVSLMSGERKSMSKPRVLVIGIDGASWNIIDRLIEESTLPTFRYLIENGVKGVLRSTYPPWTVPAWNCICSGLSPKKLGYSTFMVPSADYTFVPHTFKYKEPMYVWDYLSFAGLKVIVANVPCVYYPKEVNGIIISGWLCTNPKRIAYPPQIGNELNKVCGGYAVDIYDVDFEHGRIVGAPSQEELPHRILEVLDRRICAFKYLLSNYEWDFSFLVFTETDRVQHSFYRDWNIIREVYKRIDSFLKWFLDVVNDDTLILIVSDHGFGHTEACFKMNLWLLKEGFLRINWKYTLLLSALSVLDRKIGKLAERFKSLSFIHNIVRKLHAQLEDNYVTKLVKWSKTKVFAYGVWGSLYVNVKGRFTKGVVDPKDYEKVIYELVRKLKRHIPGVKALTKSEAYNDTDVFDYLPDIIIIPTDNGIQCIDPSISLRDIIKSRMYVKRIGGEHRLEGIFVSYGPGIKRGYIMHNSINAYDITPTILHLYGLPIPNNMDGRILIEIFDSSSTYAKMEPRYVDSSYYIKLKLATKIRSIH